MAAPSETGLIVRVGRRCGRGVHLAPARQPLRSRVVTGILSVILLSVTSEAAAQDDVERPAHVRPDIALRPLVDEAARRSAIVRASIDRLERTDVTVYIRTRAFVSSELDGRVALLAVTSQQRYLVIELSCRGSLLVQMSTLGHELYHAMEIALEPSIVDARTLAIHYQRIGTERSDGAGKQAFETEAAYGTGLRVRRELLATDADRQRGMRA